MAAGALLPVYAQTAQQAPREDLQSWTDVILTIPAHEKVNLVLSGTLRASLDVAGRPVEERAGIGVAFKLGKHVTVTPTYLAIFFQPVVGRSFTEQRPLVDVTLQVPIGKLNLTDRNRVEHRFTRPNDATRYRNRLQLDYPVRIGGHEFRLFIADEVFYDTLFDRWTINRVSAGASKAFNRHFIADLYYLRQNNAFSRPGDLHVIGLLLRVRL